MCLWVWWSLLCHRACTLGSFGRALCRALWTSSAAAHVQRIWRPLSTHISAQGFTQDMLSNYLLFVCHNVPFATKLRFLKMCIDRVPEFRTLSTDIAAIAGLPGEVDEMESCKKKQRH